ncbi:hypothetical protein POKO110462_15765 [Pontibacter korlensis]|uniref:DUF885 domain-containing protein n=1 Tax=Pontibacter korlensis TaxID=400092 RepID=A0A0E3ZBN5_9BACT|nr:hypothetical protein [Pontibacter korlensis]AKD01888.1 hypothetical protein PKOR_00375 [Pontibacter korlensis]
MKKMLLLLLAIAVWACTTTKETEKKVLPMDELAERYVKTLLRLGQYDSDIVDAYYGPEEWKPAAEPADSLPATEFLTELRLIQDNLQAQPTDTLSDLEKRRLTMFQKQVLAAITKVEMMQGKKLPFDQEAKLLYDADPPHYEQAYFDSLLAAIDADLPGTGSIADRWAAYQAKFEIRKDKLDTVFQAAITEARKRTKAHYDLPANENFKVEFVTDKPWSGYNYFQGNGYSLIQINTDFPIYIERAIDLAGHEGYPGHHVFNVLLEQHLVNEKGWKEYSIYPLFSPQSLIAEGSANYGVEVAFPAQERLTFEKQVLFPLAGLNQSEAERYYSILSKINKLNFAGNEAARLYLNGEISREEAADWLVKYNFYEKGKALQRTRFMDRYRSYVINYNLGQELVRQYVESRGGTADNPEKRWEVFGELLSTPNTASMLQE